MDTASGRPPSATGPKTSASHAETDLKLSALTVLPGVAKERYGEAFNQHRLEQYKLYVEMADRISSRRMTANSFFVTLNTSLVAFLGLAVAKQETERLGWYVAVSVAGVAVSLLWYFLIRSYRDLNSAKFNVVHLVELEMPLRLYDAEWEMVGRGKNPKLYRPVTHIETKVPLLFVAIYVGLAIYVFAIR